MGFKIMPGSMVWVSDCTYYLFISKYIVPQIQVDYRSVLNRIRRNIKIRLKKEKIEKNVVIEK